MWIELSSSHFLNTPAVVDLSDKGVHQVFDMALVNKAIVGVGDVTERSAVVAAGIISPGLMADLVRRGAPVTSSANISRSHGYPSWCGGVVVM